MTSEKQMQEMQFLEQSLQNAMHQKQAFQMELLETQAALKELESSGDEVFKIVGQLMVKTDKSKMKEDLETKEKILSTQAKRLQEQEAPLMQKLEELRKEFIESAKK